MFGYEFQTGQECALLCFLSDQCCPQESRLRNTESVTSPPPRAMLARAKWPEEGQGPATGEEGTDERCLPRLKLQGREGHGREGRMQGSNHNGWRVLVTSKLQALRYARLFPYLIHTATLGGGCRKCLHLTGRTVWPNTSIV